MSREAYEDAVIATVLKHSVDSNYNKAKHEWVYDGKVDDYGEIRHQQPKKHCQACGHNIRYGYHINNKKNKKRLILGSECINNFVAIAPSASKLKRDIKIHQDKREYNAFGYMSREYRNVEAAYITYLERKHGVVSLSNIVESYLANRIPHNAKFKKIYEDAKDAEMFFKTSRNNEAVMLKQLPELKKYAKKAGYTLDPTIIKEFSAVMNTPDVKKRWGIK